MKLTELERIIKPSWSKETTVPSLEQVWDKTNPSLGQCAITALIVNDFIGGKIMRCMCGNISHYYNLINDEIVDLTKSQFKTETPDYINGEERTREYLLSNENTKARYLILLKNVKDNFIKCGSYEYKLRDKNNEEYISKIPGTIGGNKKLKIYGKLDCPSALSYLEKGMYEKNRVFFENVETAIEAGYRPCGICMKEKYKEYKKTLTN